MSAGIAISCAPRWRRSNTVSQRFPVYLLLRILLECEVYIHCRYVRPPYRISTMLVSAEIFPSAIQPRLSGIIGALGGLSIVSVAIMKSTLHSDLWCCIVPVIIMLTLRILLWCRLSAYHSYLFLSTCGIVHLSSPWRNKTESGQMISAIKELIYQKRLTFESYFKTNVTIVHALLASFVVSIYSEWCIEFIDAMNNYWNY